jgi:hypothetical protein
LLQELGLQDKNKNKIMAKATKKIGVADIAKLAKKIRKPNEKWTDAIKRAAVQLK